MTRKVIAISGINAVDNPGPGTGIARSIREDENLDVKLIGIAYDALEPGVYMDWLFDEIYIMPYPSAEPEAILERLKYIKDSSGMNILIPCLDAELPFYIKYFHELQNMNITSYLPSMEQFTVRGKDKLSNVAQNIGLPSPDMKVVNSIDELIKGTEELGFPLMVKGAYYGADRAASLIDAQKYYHEIIAQWGYPVIIQKETAGDEINLVGVGDGKGQLLGHVTVKKMSRTRAGKIWTGVSIHNEDLDNAARKFAAHYKWKGPFELECIIHDNSMNLIEINPRFPAWVYFATGIGVNLPSMLIRDMTDMNQITGSYNAGKLYVRYTSEHITDIAEFQKIITAGEIK